MVARFAATERALHWIHAAGFAGLTASGLVLYLPALAAAIGNRPLVKAVHLAVAIAWMTGVLVVVAAGDRATLGRTRRELERFSDDDVAWLRRRPARAGRFNAGQKLHAAVQAAFAALFVVSGVLLWLGERQTVLRLPGTIAVHDVVALAAVLLVAGHLYLALVDPRTRPALEGMTHGTVSAAWARRHHPAWVPAPFAAWRPGRAGLAVAALVLVAGLVAALAVVRDTLG